HASRRVRRPIIDHPFVPRAHAGQRELGIVSELLEALARESGQERGEAHRRVHAVHVHVGDAGADVPRTAAHLVETGRFEAVLRHRPADARVEADVRQLLSLEDPGLAPVAALDDVRCARRELRREPAYEGIGWLDDVVVDRDHRVPPSRPLRLRQPRDLTRGGGGESLLRLQLLERYGHGYSKTSGSARASVRTPPCQYTGAARSTSDAFSCFWCAGAIGMGERSMARTSQSSMQVRSNSTDLYTASSIVGAVTMAPWLTSNATDASPMRSASSAPSAG